MQNQQQQLAQIKQIVHLVSNKIEQCEQQWKEKMFANTQSENQLVMVNEQSEQYSKWFENYRNAKGNIKPIGLILYFQFLKSVIVLVVILILISQPILILNYLGNGLDHFKISDNFSKQMLKFTLANQDYYRFDTLSVQQIEITTIHKWIAILSDVLCIITMILGVLWWKGRSQQIISHYNAKSPKPNLYTIKVSHLPKQITKEQIKSHFQYYGKVSQISMIKNYRDIIMLARSFVKKINKYKINSARQQKQEKILQRIKQRYQQIKLQYFMRPSSKNKLAIVAFETIEDCNRTHQLYKYKVNPDKLILKGKKLKVSKCRTQPLQINWQNYHLINKSQNKKKVFQFILMIAISLAILIALFLVKVSTGIITDNRIHLKDSEVVGLETLNLNDKKQVYSFCSSLNYSQQIQFLKICSQYLGSYRNQLILMIVFSLFVVTINLLTNRILRALVEIRRYRTIAQKNSFLIISIFVFSLLNSAIMLLIVRGAYTGPIISQSIQWLLRAPEGSLSLQTFNEFNRKWYITNGSQLIMNYVISLIICPYFHILLHFLRYLYRRNLEKKKNITVLDPDFDYCTFYAMSLKSIFFCLFYSHSIPLFYVLLLASLAIQISIAKFLLKNYVRQPMFFDTTANKSIIHILPYAIFFHVIFGLFFLNEDDIFPNQFSFTNITLKPYLITLNQIKNGYAHAIIIGIMIAFLFYIRRIYRIVTQQWIPVKAQLKKTFSEIARNPAFLSSYKMKDNPRYKTIAYTLQTIERFLNVNKEPSQKINTQQIHMIESITRMQSAITSSIIQKSSNTFCPENNLTQVQSLESQQQDYQSDSQEDQ